MKTYVPSTHRQARAKNASRKSGLLVAADLGFLRKSPELPELPCILFRVCRHTRHPSNRQSLNLSIPQIPQSVNLSISSLSGEKPDVALVFEDRRIIRLGGGGRAVRFDDKPAVRDPRRVEVKAKPQKPRFFSTVLSTIPPDDIPDLLSPRPESAAMGDNRKSSLKRSPWRPASMWRIMVQYLPIRETGDGI